jgi:6-phosphogluconate dehydrogenase
MKIAVSGLGRMGAQIARKLAENGHEVIAHNRSAEPVKTAVGYGATGAATKEEVVAAFKDQTAYIWIMLPDSIVEQELRQWLELLPKGSVLIDGGNSNFNLTKKNAELVHSAGSTFVDVGTSGGVWGYENGFSMMVGGPVEAYQQLEPVFKTLTQPQGAYAHFGTEAGSGHFVKMVHNAIEYGIMESLAEGYRLLKEGPYSELDLAAAGEVWQHGSVIVSWLNDLARQALSENPELEGIDGLVQENGEARWALETAKDIGLPMPSIQASFDVRIASQNGQTSFATKLLQAMRNKFGGHQINPN